MKTRDVLMMKLREHEQKCPKNLVTYKFIKFLLDNPDVLDGYLAYTLRLCDETNLLDFLIGHTNGIPPIEIEVIN
jgi:hypothetical protein